VQFAKKAIIYYKMNAYLVIVNASHVSWSDTALVVVLATFFIKKTLTKYMDNAYLALLLA
jgi:hypothetical protein